MAWIFKHGGWCEDDTNTSTMSTVVSDKEVLAVGLLAYVKLPRKNRTKEEAGVFALRLSKSLL